MLAEFLCKANKIVYICVYTNKIVYIFIHTHKRCACTHTNNKYSSVDVKDSNTHMHQLCESSHTESIMCLRRTNSVDAFIRHGHYKACPSVTAARVSQTVIKLGISMHMLQACLHIPFPLRHALLHALCRKTTPYSEIRFVWKNKSIQ